MDSQLRARARELGLSEADIARWEPVADDALVSALLSSLLGFEDAINELAS